MKDTVSIYKREQTKLQQIVELATTDPEIFRHEAARIYGLYIPSERKFIDKFETETTTGYEVLASWEYMLLPVMGNLRAKRSEIAFRSAMVKHLLLDADETQPAIHHVVDLRESEVIQKFITSLYGTPQKRDKYRKQRKHVMELLMLFPQEIHDLKDHHVNYVLYKQVAHDYNISIVDPHTSVIQRIRYSRRARSERKKLARSERERLAFIEGRMSEIRSVDNGIIADILDQQIDLVVVLGIRNQYEKRIAKLSGTGAKSVAKRLAIFDSETQDFRDQYTDKMVNNTTGASLGLARTITKKIDGLLLRIFDLDVTGKNQLLLYTKEYRELAHEQATILRRLR